MQSTPLSITLITGNPNKAREISKILSATSHNIEILQKSLDIPEYQGLPEEISTQKAIDAFR